MEELKWATEEEFEQICMGAIEKIVLRDKKQTRSDAIIVANEIYNKALKSGRKNAIKIYARVVNEFEMATNAEYNALRKVIFDK